MSGFFITFEGGEGVGKTTQISLLLRALEAQGFECLVTREPGGTPLGERVRDLLMGGEGERWSASAQALLNMAARDLHIREKISPALGKGEIVLSDRYADSTWVYQGRLGGVSEDFLEVLEKEIVADVRPHLTIVLDLDPEIGLARVKSRGGETDHYERAPLAFHKGVRTAFLDRAKKFPERCLVCDAGLPSQDLHRHILEIVLRRLGGRDG